MPNQTITLTTDADDGEYDGGGWFVSGFSNLIFVATPERSGWSFALTTSIPAGAAIVAAYFRVANNGAADSGANTLTLNVENVDPATNTIWSGTHIPPDADTGSIETYNLSEITWADGFYFGQSDTNPLDITQAIQDLVDTYGGIASGERVNIWLRETAGTGFPAFEDTSHASGRDPQLFIDWTDEPAEPAAETLHQVSTNLRW